MNDAAQDSQQTIAELQRRLAERTAERDEALERQTASADILTIIASSPSDVQPVFNALVLTARRLLGREMATILLCGEDPTFRPVAGAGPDGLVPIDPIFAVPTKIDPEANFPSRAIVSKKNLHLPDWSAIDLPEQERNIREMIGWSSTLYLPMLRGKECIGVLLLGGIQPGIFSEADIALAESFRDQAVIAIENARLFNETREALQQQTATADVLKLISRSTFDLDAVMHTLARSAAELCAAGLCGLYIREGDVLLCRGYTAISKEQEEFVRRARIPADDTNFATTRALLSGEIVNIGDFENNRSVATRAFQEKLGFKSLLIVPLMREGHGIGVFVLGRDRVGEFSLRHIELVQTFADQAVIAIENARLFEEVQAKTGDLEESLQQQTATADVLKVISRSAFDLEPALVAICETAARLCLADQVAIFTRESDLYRFAASFGFPPEYGADWRAAGPRAIDPNSPLPGVRSVVERRPVHVLDVTADPAFHQTASRQSQARTALGIPLLRDGEPVGNFVLGRRRVEAFTDRQIELVQTFADQAVIAIENARLFNEVQQRTRELSKSLDELRTAQDRLVQTEKLASLGQLTAGIAHEIKNPLNFVNNFSALSAELVDEMTEVFENTALDEASRRKELDEIRELLKSNLEKVVQHGKRADSIVKNMLLHSRESAGEHRPVDINAIVDESLNLAYHGARAEKAGFNIVLQRDLDPSIGMADVYPQEITRVLLNMISNGFYAATKRKAEAGDGFEPTLAAVTKDLGDKIEIRIRDNGTGIPDEVKEKIFNPFFTTKPSGEGTGLGLSMSHDIIVKQHGGSIEVETELGRFTQFKIVLPRISQRLSEPVISPDQRQFAAVHESGCGP